MDITSSEYINSQNAANGGKSIFFAKINRNMISPLKAFRVDYQGRIFQLSLILPLITIASSFPFFAHQFTITWLPSGSVTESGANTTTFALPAVYNGYSRYTTLAGFQLKSTDSIAFTFFLSTQTSTSQQMTFYPFNGTVLYTISFYIVFLQPNDWMWAYQQSYSFTNISLDDTLVPLTSWIMNQAMNRTVPTGVLNISDFQVSPYIQWYWASVNDVTRNIPIAMVIDNFDISSDFSQVYLVFKRSFPDCQLLKNVGMVVFVTNYTHLTLISIPNYYYSKGIFSIDSKFLSSSFGGYDGNCLFGYYTISVYPDTAKHGNTSLLFDATVIPLMIYNILSPTVSNSFNYYAICFYHCPDGQYYSNAGSQCLNCTMGSCIDCSALITNCSQCQQYTSVCSVCINGYGLNVAGTCSSCQVINPNCGDCLNSTYCAECVNNTFFLNNNTCQVCSSQIFHCQTCSSATVCIACSAGYHVTGNPNQCKTCGQVMQYCSLCSNLTVCQACVNSSYAVVSPSYSCVLCSQIFIGCLQCSSKTCTQCQVGMMLRNGQKNCQCMIGIYQNELCVIPGCVYTVTLNNGLSSCLQCNSSDFSTNPVNGHCKCLSGNLIETTCSNIPNCIAATSTNGSITCLFCNITAGFQDKPENNKCVCKAHLSIKDGVCSDICGDGFLMNLTSETSCDDGNSMSGDGCSSNCVVETQYRCDNGSSSSASVCFYIGGKISLALKEVEKTSGKNEAVFQFNVSPALSGFAKMDLSRYFILSCDAVYNVTNIEYSSAVITINADYSSNFQGVPCNATLSFDRNIIRSPNAKTSFITNSNNFPLTFSKNLAQIISFGFIFQIITYCVLAVFILSLPHKMIGAQLLICCQMVYLSNCFYKIPSFQFSIVSNFSLVTGYWSLFYSSVDKKLLSPFTERVETTPFFLQSNLFLVCGLGLFLLLCLPLKTIQSLRNLVTTEQNIETSKQKLRVVCLRKILQTLYKSFIFPFVAGFLIVVSISALIQSLRLSNPLQSHFTQTLNSLAQLFTLSYLGLVFGIEFFGNNFVKNQGYAQFRPIVGETDAKDWYIPTFLIKQIALVLTIQFGIVSGTFSKLIYALMLIQLGYFFTLIFGKPYKSLINKLGAIFCSSTQLYSIFLALISQFVDFSEDIFAMMLVGMFFLISTSTLLSLIRIVYVYKQMIINLCRQNIKNVQKTTDNGNKSKAISSLVNYQQNKRQKERKDKKKSSQLDSDNAQKLMQDFFNPFLHRILDQQSMKMPLYNHQTNNESIVPIKTSNLSRSQIQESVLLTQKKRLKQSFLILSNKRRKK